MRNELRNGTVRNSSFRQGENHECEDSRETKTIQETKVYKEGVRFMALFKYPGRKTWWYEFRFAGQTVRESAKTRSITLARRAENARKRDLEESYNGLKKRTVPRLFSAASEEWLAIKKASLAPRSYIIEKANLKHLLPVFGKTLIGDIDAADISKYQQQRLAEEASPKTVNLEIGTLRVIDHLKTYFIEHLPE
jgi:hypothetical protein